MCRAASFVLTKYGVFWSKTSNSHEQIIREHNLPDGHISEAACFRPPQILRVEITPEDHYDTLMETWKYHVDQTDLPDWADGAEARARSTLTAWAAYHNCQQTGQFLFGGFRVHQRSDKNATQTAGDKSTQTAGYAATQTAGKYATQTAGYAATQTAGDAATQTAGGESTQTAGDRSTQTAGDGVTQIAKSDATQTARNSATQTAEYAATQVAKHRATQTAGYGSTQTAGDRSTQIAGDESIQTAGLGSVQITRWFVGEWQIATRVITDAEANKPYRVVNGVWTLIE